MSRCLRRILFSPVVTLALLPALLAALVLLPFYRLIFPKSERGRR